MKNLEKIKREIEAVDKDLKVVTNQNGLDVFVDTDDNILWSRWLIKIIAIAQRQNLGHYVDFEKSCIRIHD